MSKRSPILPAIVAIFLSLAGYWLVAWFDWRLGAGLLLWRGSDWLRREMDEARREWDERNTR